VRSKYYTPPTEVPVHIINMSKKEKDHDPSCRSVECAAARSFRLRYVCGVCFCALAVLFCFVLFGFVPLCIVVVCGFSVPLWRTMTMQLQCDWHWHEDLAGLGG
jgi:hypothetical protein